MLVMIENVVPLDVCDRIVRDCEEIGWLTPKVVAGQDSSYVDEVKQHTELRSNNDTRINLNSALLQDYMKKCKDLVNYTIPFKFRDFQFNNYIDGGNYDYHSETADMNGLRTDFTCLVSLTDPNDYVGGAHTAIQKNGVPVSLRPPKGSVVTYPTGLVHKAEPVTEGQRVIAVCWIQSCVRNTVHRDLCREALRLNSTCKDIERHGQAHREATSLYNNLRRAFC